ncbi:post-GPI attachment to proteins factor 3-like [Lineus longissimus]|uniref:post-GPI attachment to proteins factor 3-like n=1 Tax=Lineus longissimus TaxID=88925 RepID=UPI002B4EB48E
MAWSLSVPTYVPVLVVLSLFLEMVTASVGDRSSVYTTCLGDCRAVKCDHMSEEGFSGAQPFHLRLLLWGCGDECRYDCMWQAVDAFHENGSKIPQFHGKWPFIRVLGIQEPVSVIASILNFLSVAAGIIHFWRRVTFNTPMYFAWSFYAFTGFNAWFWSAVFHTRDFPFTEMLDYFCALSLVMTSLLCLVLRLAGTRPLWKSIVIPFPFVLYYAWHCYYLAYVRFDYGFNMKVNLSFGVVVSLTWATWCMNRWRKRPYVKKCVAALVILNASLLLEVFDFPPVFWTFDAHSLWHIGTIPVGYLWFSFVADDCVHIANALERKIKLL